MRAGFETEGTDVGEMAELFAQVAWATRAGEMRVRFGFADEAADGVVLLL